MKSRTYLALGMSAVLAATSGAAVLAAGSAQAYGPAQSDLNCKLYFGDTGSGSSVSTYTDNFTLTQTPAYAPVGSTVSVTFSGATGPHSGPANVDANTNVVVATIALSGAQTGDVVAKTTAAYPASNIPGATPNPATLGAYTASGSYVVSKAGATTAALKLLKFDNTTVANVDTYCQDGPTGDIKAGGGVVSAKIKDTKTNGDSVKPVATIKAPAAKAAKVTSLSGTVTDAGSGPKSVSVKVYEKVSGKWYAFNGKKLVKKASKAKAIKAAKVLNDTSVSNGKWSVPVKKLKKGTLYVNYTATDKANNASAAKTYSKKLK